MKSLGLFILMSVLASLGCQSSPVKTTCNETDWFELGRRDGAGGQPLAMTPHQRRCGKFFDSLNETLFTSGYNNGLSEYCAIDNGYAIGRSGGRPQLVCPAPMDAPFMAAFDRGLKARDLEETNQKLDRQISSLNQKLNQGEAVERGTLLSELSSLVQERAANTRKLIQIERQIN